jgi:hypothetical protein
MSEDTLTEDRLSHLMDRRAGLLEIDIPPETVIAGRARPRHRRHVALTAVAVTVVLAAVASLVLVHQVPRHVSTAGDPGTGAVDGDVTHVVLDGWTATYYIDDPAQGPSTPDYVEYQWTAPSRSLQLSFYPPDARGPADGTGDTLPGGFQRVAIRATTGRLLSYGSDGRFRADWDEGGRTWEADGSGFPSAQAFIETVASLHHTDQATWLAALPRGTVTAAQRPAAVDALLKGVPVPPGLDLTPERNADRMASPYNLAADVYGHVECAWISQLDTTRGTPAAQPAIQALGTVPGWPGMAALDAGGGYGSEVRDLATQAIAGPVSDYKAALGC